ncbi:hypothetical protein BYT27DRAFT_7216269 [Phlegmacium glaucopus]|nr:hypothetical protein BYT27DRAFT_7216269 [Phlegmacium glaucopus]
MAEPDAMDRDQTPQTTPERVRTTAQRNERDQRTLDSPEYRRIPTVPMPMPVPVPPFVVPAVPAPARPLKHCLLFHSKVEVEVEVEVESTIIFLLIWLQPLKHCLLFHSKVEVEVEVEVESTIIFLLIWLQPLKHCLLCHSKVEEEGEFVPPPVPLPFANIAAQYAALPPMVPPPPASPSPPPPVPPPLPFADVAAQYGALAPMVPLPPAPSPSPPPAPPAPLTFAEIAQQYAALPPLIPPASSFHSPPPSPPPPVLPLLQPQPHIPPQHINVQAAMEEAQRRDERWMQQRHNGQRNQQCGEGQLRIHDITNHTSRHLPSTPPPNNQPQEYVDVQAAMESAER